jgi:hypothetical protein
VDFELFKSKLYGSIEYYNKTTKNPILNIPSPPLSPTPTVWANVGAEIINKGVEITLGSQIINTKDLSLSVDVNGSTLNNTIKDLPVSELYSGSISGPGLSGVTANIYKNGYAAGSFFMLKHLGYDQNGKSKTKIRTALSIQRTGRYFRERFPNSTTASMASCAIRPWICQLPLSDRRVGICLTTPRLSSTSTTCRQTEMC